MATNEESVSRTIEAPAATIYKIIADYVNHHPNILPEAYFEGLDVLEGGVGEGTRIDVFAKIKGSRQTLRMGVTEPQPGRVLVETDLDGGITTTFTLEPLADRQTDLTISTAWPPASGFQALFNRFFLPRYVRGMLQAELEQIAEYVAGLED